MCADNKMMKPNLLASVLTNKCPRCRRGHLFTVPNPYKLKTTMRMPERCEVCGQKFELETGFYFGTGFVSYGLSVAILMMIFVLWGLTLGLSVYDNSIIECLVTGIILLVGLQPVLQRMARSIWIYFFVKYDGEWMRVKE